VKKAEHAEQGTRLWPTNMSKDADLNFRFDKGLYISNGKAKVVLQANNCHDPADSMRQKDRAL